MMKFGILLGVFLVFSQTSGEFCYDDVKGACGSKPITIEGPLLANCNAKYGKFKELQPDLQAYADDHIETSFEFLLMSTHFGNYEMNRDGFKGLFRKLSDKHWNKAIDIIKFITKRGGRMNFNQQPRFEQKANDSTLSLNELNSLAKALDTSKRLADEALRIHTTAQHHKSMDASVAHYIEEEFLEDQAETVRTLAGHTSDFKGFLADRDSSLFVFLFDEYFKKTL
uniref:Ferritin n=1 Tax=Asobara tabida TaxID=58720 RepID=D1GLP3_ASOTA|nr:ferritin light chain [Asobara tabida]